MGGFTTEWERPEFDSVPSLAENMVYLLPGCASVLIRKTLQATYRDFCKRSAVLRTWRRIELEPGVGAYPIAPILSGEIDCITQVLFAHSRVPVRRWRVFGDAPLMLKLPRGLARPSINVSSPSKVFAASVMVEAVEVPHISEERAPRSFLQRYGDALIDGALVRLFSMTGKAWTDAEQARQHGIAYSNELTEARQRSMNGGLAANAGGGLCLDMSSMV